MSHPLTADQVCGAAQALGFTIATDVVPVSPDPQASDDQLPPDRETTILLATLEALIVRWQIDQDLRDPAGVQVRQNIAVEAQAGIGGELDALAVVIRRLETIQGVLSGITDRPADGPAFPAPDAAVGQLFSAVELLLAASVASRVSEDPALGLPADMLTDDTAALLVAQATRQVDAVSGLLHEWTRARCGEPA